VMKIRQALGERKAGNVGQSILSDRFICDLHPQSL